MPGAAIRFWDIVVHFHFSLEYMPNDQNVILNNIDNIDLKDILNLKVGNQNQYNVGFWGGDYYYAYFSGYELKYSEISKTLSGNLDKLELRNQGSYNFTLNNISISAEEFWSVIEGSNFEAFSHLLSGDDFVYGSDVADLIRGYAGNDFMQGGTGADSLFGGSGNDLIYGAESTNPAYWDGRDASNFLRGEEGDDTLYGAAAFDDIHGNMGNDVGYGRAGNDWVVGGKDQDRLYGDEGDDVVLGNMGLDTLDGGAGNDTVRGGQDDDILQGGDGNDWLSGDRGSDTITGGMGADIFHSSTGAGLDRITDFNRAEGDRVVLGAGTAYSLRQTGADTVIDLGGGDQVVLVGVNLSSLSGDWLGVFP